MINGFMDRLPIAIVFMTASLICYLLSQRPALSKRDEKKLKELNDIIARAYGGK